MYNFWKQNGSRLLFVKQNISDHHRVTEGGERDLWTAKWMQVCKCECMCVCVCVCVCL